MAEVMDASRWLWFNVCSLKFGENEEQVHLGMKLRRSE